MQTKIDNKMSFFSKFSKFWNNINTRPTATGLRVKELLVADKYKTW